MPQRTFPRHQQRHGGGWRPTNGVRTLGGSPTWGLPTWGSHVVAASARCGASIDAELVRPTATPPRAGLALDRQPTMPNATRAVRSPDLRLGAGHQSPIRLLPSWLVQKATFRVFDVKPSTRAATQAGQQKRMLH